MPKTLHPHPPAKSAAHSQPLWKHLLAALPTICAITAATFFLEHYGFLDHFETAGLDAFNLLQSARDPSDVVLLGIDDQDYEDKALFSATSPLKCETVQRILDAIAAGHPRVIGVDLDTSPDTYACLQVRDSWPPIIWGEDGLWDPKSETFEEVRPLAGKGPVRPQDAYGLAKMPQDASDGVVRRYRREFPLKNGGHAPSLAWAIFETAAKAGCKECEEAIAHASPESEHGLVLNFAGHRFNVNPLSIRHILQVSDTPGWQENGPLKDKIAILGGYYWQARDSLVTPIGMVPSLNIVGQAIETELRGGGIRPLDETVAVILDILGGLLVVYINFRYHHRLALALLLSLLAIPLVALSASFLAFSTLARWFNFIPVAIGILIHEFYDHAREYQRLRESQ